jgi:hypothetical protein
MKAKYFTLALLLLISITQVIAQSAIVSQSMGSLKLLKTGNGKQYCIYFS